MDINAQDRQNLAKCCLGNKQAEDFLAMWSEYVNLIDDIVDEDLNGWGNTSPKQDANANRERGVERICRMGALAAVLYSHPFYLANLMALRQIALNCTNAYHDSALWEVSGTDWKREWADHYRHFGAEMVIAVAGICGGYDHIRAVSPMLRTICYQSHHDDSGASH